MTLAIHEATPDELVDWDAHTVDAPGGNVYQSRLWAVHRSKLGWRPRHLVFEDGFRLLSLERPWPFVGGAGAYLSRGPITAGEPVERTADRLRAAADWLARRGVDVVSSDSEVPAASGYPALLRARGFRQIEEVQPSRHRLSLRFPPDRDEDALLHSFSTTQRQRLQTAEKLGLRVIRFDVGAGLEVGSGFEAPPAGTTGEGSRSTFEGFYDLLRTTAARRGFHLGPRAAFVDWSAAALATGLVVYLEVRSPDDTILGGSTFYRHGGRLTYSHSGDRADLRREYPGVVALALWRAIQIALRSGLAEMDLAGVDVPGLRREPRQGETMYGLYQFKRMFGAEWVELSGNHEWVARPWRYLAGRVTGRLGSGLPGRGGR